MNVVRGLGIAAEHVIEDAEAEQAHGGHREAHDGPSEEGHRQRLGCAHGMSGRGGSDVGFGGRVHADPAGRRGRQRADDEGDGCFGAQGDVQDDQQRGCEAGKHGVLAAHEDHGALVNGVRDLLDLVGSLVVPLHQPEDDEGDDQADDTEYGRYQRNIVHWIPQLDDHVWSAGGMPHHVLVVARYARRQRSARREF